MNNISNIAQDIISIKYGSNINKNKKSFYRIMRKYGIKKGTKHDNGAICMSNPEWIMCFALFTQTMNCWIQIDDLTDKDIPEDLKY